MDAVRAVEGLTLLHRGLQLGVHPAPGLGSVELFCVVGAAYLVEGGAVSLSDLVRPEQIKQPALTSAVAKLERDGLVERRADPCDAGP